MDTIEFATLIRNRLQAKAVEEWNDSQTGVNPEFRQMCFDRSQAFVSAVCMVDDMIAFERYEQSQKN